MYSGPTQSYQIAPCRSSGADGHSQTGSRQPGHDRRERVVFLKREHHPCVEKINENRKITDSIPARVLATFRKKIILPWRRGILLACGAYGSWCLIPPGHSFAELFKNLHPHTSEPAILVQASILTYFVLTDFTKRDILLYIFFLFILIILSITLI
jgi:hypothetical protein